MSRMLHSSVTKVAALLYLLLALSFPQHAEAACNIYVDTAYQWSDLTPIIVPPPGAETTYSSVPDLATDRAGVWGALFQSYTQEDAPGVLLFSRSTDNGESWTTASDLIQSTSESVVLNSEVLATDGKGVWLAAWQRDVEPESHVYFSRSMDNGLTWSTATQLPGILPEYLSSSVYDLETNRNGTWIITWSADNGGGEQTTFVSRSQDNGDTWSSPVELEALFTFFAPRAVASDEKNTWVIAGSDDSRLIVSRSVDDGLTWSTPSNTFRSAYSNNPISLKTDTFGLWVILAGSGGIVEPLISYNNGLSWFPNNLFHSASVALGIDFDEGRWITLVKFSPNLHYETSFDTETWSGIFQMPGLPGPGFGAIETDQNGTWVVAYGTENPHITRMTTLPDDADLSVVKSVVTEDIELGEPLDYLLEITNSGRLDATSVTLTDQLPENVTFVAAVPDQGTCIESDLNVLCSLGTLPCQTSTTVLIRVIPDEVGTLVNSATVTSNRIDRNLEDNTTTVTTEVTTDADLAISVTDLSDPTTVGETLTYILLAENQGPETAYGVQVIDTLPAGVTFVSATSSSGSCSEDAGTVTCVMPPIAAGSSETVTIEVIPATPSVISNDASITGVVFDPDSSNNFATESTTVVEPPAPQAPDLLGKWNSINLTCRTLPRTTICRVSGILNIENLGVPTATRFVVRYYLSDDAVLDANDTRLRGQSILTVRTDSNRDVRVTRFLPPGTNASGKYLIAHLDSTDRIDETSETNNAVVIGLLP